MASRLHFEKEFSGGENCIMHITCNGLPIASLKYVPNGESAEIKAIVIERRNPEWQDGFRKRFGVFPSEYLLEELIRGGTKRFTTNRLSLDGTRWVEALVKRKSIAYNKTEHPSKFGSLHIIDISPRLKSTALKRRRRLP